MFRLAVLLTLTLLLLSKSIFSKTRGGKAQVRIPQKFRNDYGQGTCHYRPELAHKMMLLGAVAYSQFSPQECLDRSLPADKFQIQSVVTRTCDLVGSKCSSYIAISHNVQAIVIAFRGTQSVNQLISELLETVFSSMEDFLGGKVQTYWKKSFEILWKDMEPTVKSLISSHPSYQIWVTGHSLGGAMASLASAWIAYENILSRQNIIMYTFGMPRVGDYKYAMQHDQLVNNSWRIVNFDDIVPRLPPFFPGSPKGAYHHGVEVFYTEPVLSVYSAHKECHGKPIDEDKACSRGLVITNLKQSIKHHTNYFGVHFEQFCATSL